MICINDLKRFSRKITNLRRSAIEVYSAFICHIESKAIVVM